MESVLKRVVLLLGFFTLALYLFGSLEKGTVEPSLRLETNAVELNRNGFAAYHPYQAISHGAQSRMPAPVAVYDTSNVISRNGYTSAQFAMFPQFPDNMRPTRAVSGNGLFSDAKGWYISKYFSTVQTVTDGSIYYIVGRGYCGMYIYKYSEGELSTVNECGIEFANTNGWGDVDHYSTIHATVANGSLYISGRGNCGMHIYKIVDNKPKVISMCEIKFSDEEGWARPEYYSTIQTTTANGNLYVFGRGKCGIEMYQTWEDKIYLVSACLIPFSDELGWNQEKYYSTITSAVLYEHIYVIARAPCGIVIYRTLTGKQVELISNCDITWSDADGWGAERFYSTIRAVADSRSVWIVGRAAKGIIIWKVVGKDVILMNQYGIEWSDALNWYHDDRYSSIGAAVVDDVLHIYGREDCGMTIYIVSGNGVPVLVASCRPNWSNLSGWSSEKYYSTIQGSAGHGLVLSARSPCGYVVYEEFMLSSTLIVGC